MTTISDMPLRAVVERYPVWGRREALASHNERLDCGHVLRDLAASDARQRPCHVCWAEARSEAAR